MKSAGWLNLEVSSLFTTPLDNSSGWLIVNRYLWIAIIATIKTAVVIQIQER